jgi:hypothetical protein
LDQYEQNVVSAEAAQIASEIKVAEKEANVEAVNLINSSGGYFDKESYQKYQQVLTSYYNDTATYSQVEEAKKAYEEASKKQMDKYAKAIEAGALMNVNGKLQIATQNG